MTLYEQRLALVANGYLPVPCKGKRPPDNMGEWLEKCKTATETDISNWDYIYPEATNTGVVTGEVVVIDIDDLTPGHSATIKNIAEDIFGRTPLLRIGKSPKVALFYRAGQEKWRKAAIKNCVEVMADGQQVVVFGVHPDTGQPYRWPFKDPLEVPVSELPEITFEQVATFIEAVAEELKIDPDRITRNIRDRNGQALPIAGPTASNQPEDNVIPMSAAPRIRKKLNKILAEHFLKLTTTAAGDRNNALFRSAAALGSYVASGQLAKDEVQAVLIQACQTNGLYAEDPEGVIGSIDSGLNRGSLEPRELTLNWNNVNVAKEWLKEYGDDFIFAVDQQHWFYWEGTHWVKDETFRATEKMIEFCDRRNADQNDKLGSIRFIEDSLTTAQAMPGVSVKSHVFDKDTWLINTPAGTYDCRSGVLRPHERKDLITKIAACAPQPGPHPKWSKFLDEATQGDKALQRFLQQICGYCLTGSVKEQALFFFYGEGGNGKSVFTNMLKTVLKDYGAVAGLDTLTDGKSSGLNKSNDLASLRGARIALVSETEEGRPWSEVMVKTITGGTEVTARVVYERNQTWMPQFKVIVSGNNKPVLKVVDEAMKRRFNIIPFTHKPAVPNPDLEEEIRTEELPQVFAWMLEGLRDWRENGLVRPPVVLDATAEYMDDQDFYLEWLLDYCDLLQDNPKADPKLYVQSNHALFQSFSYFMEITGRKQHIHEGRFRERLKRYSDYGIVHLDKTTRIHSENKRPARGFSGLRLKPGMQHASSGGRGGYGADSSPAPMGSKILSSLATAKK